MARGYGEWHGDTANGTGANAWRLLGPLKCNSILTGGITKSHSTFQIKECTQIQFNNRPMPSLSTGRTHALSTGSTHTLPQYTQYSYRTTVLIVPYAIPVP
eukprot:3941354-Rhodomonas_salina.1